MKAVFLDRDGTVIVDPDDLRVNSVAELELFPDTIQALELLTSLDYGVFMVTNQAGIAEGLIDQHEADHINNTLLEMLAPSGIRILKTYMCPHQAKDNCVCRKPKPTMLLQAAKEYDIDLPNSYMIGDRQSDILAGVNAGTKTILVQTGNTPVTSTEATFTAPTILEAIQYIADSK